VSGGLWPVLAGLFGLLGGGFANALIARLPKEHPFQRGLFTCEHCERRGGLLDLVPILGWLWRSGRCRVCRAHVRVQEPVVDAINGVLWLLIAASNPFSPRALALMGFVTVLVVLALIDLEHQILPDMITLPAIVVGVALTQLPGWPVSLLDSALSAALGYFAMMILAKAAEMYYREEALGQGDWKMIAMLGAFLGSTKLAFVALAANLLGALVGLLMIAIMGDEGRQRLPLGTFLGACGITIIFF
jgi:leader peptidase (prepilin peptidase)/N-methyltransferase